MKEIRHDLTLHQERLAYRRAVQRSLEVFFEKSASEAAQIVDAWWVRMECDSIFKTGFFMHYEPINTAADLAGWKHAPAMQDIAETYSKVIAEAMPKPRKSRKKAVREALTISNAA
jgi:hypothetical protein